MHLTYIHTFNKFIHNHNGINGLMKNYKLLSEIKIIIWIIQNIGFN
jgi:hypothetical protein